MIDRRFFSTRPHVPGALQSLAAIAIMLAGALASGCATSVQPPGDVPASASTRVELALDPGKLEAMLAQSSIVANVPAARTLAFYGMHATAQRDSTVYLNVNVDGVAVAVLAGQVRFTGHTMRGGELCFWSRAATDVQVADFDAASFLSEHELTLEKHVVSSLEEAAARQADGLWWGAVERVPLQF